MEFSVPGTKVVLKMRQLSESLSPYHRARWLEWQRFWHVFGSCQFESRQRHLLSWLRFRVVFFKICRQSLPSTFSSFHQSSHPCMLEVCIWTTRSGIFVKQTTIVAPVEMRTANIFIGSCDVQRPRLSDSAVLWIVRICASHQVSPPLAFPWTPCKLALTGFCITLETEIKMERNKRRERN
jgi:hypothetical protein